MTKAEKRAATVAEKVNENRVRRMAEALGLALQRSKSRREFMPGYGRYRIARPYFRNEHAKDGVTFIRNGEPIGFEVVAGGFPIEFGFTLDEAEAWLTGDRSADPIGYGDGSNFYALTDKDDVRPEMKAYLMGQGLTEDALKRLPEWGYPTTGVQFEDSARLMEGIARGLTAIAFHQKEVARALATLKQRAEDLKP